MADNKDNKVKKTPFHKAVVSLLEECYTMDALRVLVILLEKSLPHKLTRNEKRALIRALDEASKRVTGFGDMKGHDKAVISLEKKSELVDRGKAAVRARGTKKKPSKE